MVCLHSGPGRLPQRRGFACAGDFDVDGVFTLNDAVHVAAHWSEMGQPPGVANCAGGDLDGRGDGFTLQDAIFVASVWAGQAKFVWDAVAR